MRVRSSKSRYRNTLFAVTAFVLVGITAIELGWWSAVTRAESATASEAVVELSWENLVPAGYAPPTNPLDAMSTEELEKLFDGSEDSNRELAEIEEILSFAPTNPDLDGKRVKLPGYVVPLDFDGQTKLEEFLVVPYYGACIHTPPPPANQVVHANAQQAVTVEDQYLPIWAIGTLRTQTTVSNLAESGYRLEVEEVQPYE